jgi:Protein of unknown function (DUF664)
MNASWTAPVVERGAPARIAGERASLEQWLDFHRATLLVKCGGLTAEQLKARPVPPSTLSLLGLVRHMAEVEHWWFTMHAAQRTGQLRYWAGDDPDADFNDTEGADPAADIETYRCEIDHSRAAVAGLDLDTVVPSRGDHAERARDIRWIYQHMIEEYARHNGHADLIRERLDGVTGD